ncbi:beta-L-arabinofuranosidase domain-containing protein [Niabella ginsengisoli]|uniref:Glycoside hydrolase family 127 protein n=1 Tax=Niabella ginsengisoli TaxID=522298 RepID=A0ABS9SI09_9BACT|nr:beta-L-arabinofuranosidase domain-containing protein [Niabella ginsengisoli]MCH5598008.1 glycoside hydrolase family 127 protein [Niabella ginsengisoli]
MFGRSFLIANSIYAQIGNPLPELNDASLLKLRAWNKVELGSADKTYLKGLLGACYNKSIKRLELKPYSTDWLMADVTFKVKRIFTNYSGDVSGRFIELGALLSTPDSLYPEKTLPATLSSIARYQKPDGHFGVPIDLNKQLKANDAVVTLLWGNARMLVGLITAWEKFKDDNLLQSAKRLGDFYVKTAEQLCNPAREAEYKATGTAADSYQVGYFPAMEGLVMLYKVTNDERYLKMAERMAAFFLKFDGLPLNHSHGNLSAWRSILDLYNTTGKQQYLDQAIEKWKESVRRGYVWSIGGVGEHWYVDYKGSEGCSESDWLRFNLDLWRYTGQTSYLDMAERLLENQYIADQSGNGGFGMRHFDVIKDVGPIATYGGVNEWDFCCSFHGPLGLYFFKKYMVTYAGEKLYVNFPYTFDTQLQTEAGKWNITTKADSAVNKEGNKKMFISVTSADEGVGQKINLYLRVPIWANKVTSRGKDLEVVSRYALLKADVKNGESFEITFEAVPFVEARNFVKVATATDRAEVFKDVSLVLGSQLLYEYPARNNSLSNLLVLKTKEGKLKLLRDANGSFASVQLSNANVNRDYIIAALQQAKKYRWFPGL